MYTVNTIYLSPCTWTWYPPMSATQTRRQKARRNVTLDPEIDDWLASDVQNASALINDLLQAYKAYGEASEAIAYVEQKQRVQGPR